MGVRELAEFKSLVAAVKGKTIENGVFCVQVIQLLNGMGCELAQKLELCRKLAVVLPPSLKAQYMGQATSVFGHFMQEQSAHVVASAEASEGGGAMQPQTNAPPMPIRKVPTEDACRHDSVEASAPSVSAGVESSAADGLAASNQPQAPPLRPSRSKQGSQLFMLQARGILNAEQIATFKALLVDAKRGEVSKAEMPMRALAIFDQVCEAADRAMLMAGFKEFVGAEHRPKYTAAVAQRQVQQAQHQRRHEAEPTMTRPKKRDMFDLIAGAGSTVAKRKRIVPRVDAAAPLELPAATSEPESPRPIVRAQVGDATLACQICGEERQLHSARCAHEACLQCWSQWLSQNLCCPFCRQRCRLLHLKEVQRD